jgi:hypothetical protein
MLFLGVMWAFTDADGCNGILNILILVLARWLRSINLCFSSPQHICMLGCFGIALPMFTWYEWCMIGSQARTEYTQMKEQSPPPIHEINTPYWLRFDACCRIIEMDTEICEE